MEIPRVELFRRNLLDYFVQSVLIYNFPPNLADLEERNPFHVEQMDR
jgi:hypothetical protein